MFSDKVSVLQAYISHDDKIKLMSRLVSMHENYRARYSRHWLQILETRNMAANSLINRTEKSVFIRFTRIPRDIGQSQLSKPCL
jgi:hypothetical protein